MKIYLPKLAAATLVAVSAAGLTANNPYDGQYEVNRIDAIRSAFDYKQGEIIVKFKSEGKTRANLVATRSGVKASSNASALNALLDKYGASNAEELMPLTGDIVTSPQTRSKAFNGENMEDKNLSSLYVIRMDAGKARNLQEVMKDFEALDEIEYVEPNYIVHTCAATATDYISDPLYSQQWGPAAIGLDKLWEVPLNNTKRPVIAILDTGVDITHPDLADNIWTNTLEADGVEGNDDDHNGFDDDVHGWDFVNNSARMRDNNGHGTHCAGIAAAVGGNGIGITGANPEALIMPVTVMQSNGQGDVATIIKGIDYAVANGADVISMSFGGYADSMAERDALAKAYQKAILVAAAGNDNLCIYYHDCPVNRKIGSPVYPAAYNFVLGVEASADANGSLASFSNFDEDGPITSTFAQLENYELRAPGVGIMSTFPNGQYKQLNGTSMACPLVAGAISRLVSVKEISSKEELFGDLIHTSNGNLNIFNAYNLSDDARKPTLSLVTYRLDDEKMGDGDGRPDAGETIRFYPTLRNAWGYAKNITYSLEVAENEDPNIIEFVDGNTHALSNLSSYAMIEAENPILIKINPECVDGRNISLVFKATCDNISSSLEQEIVLNIENGVELGGIIKKDLTLTSDKNYIVTSNLGVPDGVTLTILPGTTIKFKDDTRLMISGHINAQGEPNRMITFTKADLSLGNVGSINFGLSDTISYCKIENLTFTDQNNDVWSIKGNFINCIYQNCSSSYPIYGSNWVYSNILNLNSPTALAPTGSNIQYSNVIGNSQPSDFYENCFLSAAMIDLFDSNSFNNIYCGEKMSMGYYMDFPTTYINERPNYHGTSNKDIAQSRILDIKHPLSRSVGEYDLTNMLIRPNSLAHGIVWKVVVNGYDAQDEFELLPPLGVGKQKFEVYFSRKMNHEKSPMVAMGVREPYSQTAIAEDGSWRSETMENGDVIDIYTCYLTIQGKDNFDGLNTIYVADAEDDEFFPIPIEDVRFHVNVQTAGSMSAGFVAEPGVGKVTLTWENPEENFDDMLGYNLYRYILKDAGEPNDTVRINETLLNEEKFIDYDIVPGTTYCYYYKVLRTSMDENAPSRIVSATPRAAGKGDSNGSGNVDVADVVTEVNYMVGRDPKPFIFDAADVNDDSEVDILDVVGTVNIIMAPQSQNAIASVNSSATYSIENGTLYIDTPVELAGIQLALDADRSLTEIKVLDGLKGMETTGEWMSDKEYRFISFSLSGKTIQPGKTALLSIGDADVVGITLVDSNAKEVLAIRENTSGISSIVMHQMETPAPNPFEESIDVPVVIGMEGSHSVVLSLVNLAGSNVYSMQKTLDFGKHTVRVAPGNISSGFYMLTMSVDGKLVQTCKVIKK